MTIATLKNDFATLNSCIPTAVLKSKSGPTTIKDVTAKKAGKTIAKKRTWKKPKGKPKRPLSAYNFFFQDEREKIVAAVKLSDDSATTSFNKATNAKQANCKPRGKIGFANLARNIAAKWKVLDESSKCQYEVRAEADKERYIAELTVWNEKQNTKEDESIDKDLAIPKCKNHTSVALSHISSNSQPPLSANIYSKSFESMAEHNCPFRENDRNYDSSDSSHTNYTENDSALYQQQKEQCTESDDLINILHDSSKIGCDTFTSELIEPKNNEFTNQRWNSRYNQDTCPIRRNSLFGIIGETEPGMLQPNYFAYSLKPCRQTHQDKKSYSESYAKNQILPPGTDEIHDDLIEMLALITSD